jgi:hypothetical protein
MGTYIALSETWISIQKPMILLCSHSLKWQDCNDAIIPQLFLFLFLLFRSTPLCSDVLDLLHQSTPPCSALPHVFDHTYLT